MTMSTPLRRLLRAAPPAALATALLAGCGAGTAATSATGATGAAATGQSTDTQNAAVRAFPGASGKIADISGKTLQVQSTTAQTAVTYTAATAFTDTQAGKAADLAVGKCVNVRDAAAADPTTATAATDPVTATSITISDAVNGACTGGPGGGGTGGGAGGPGFRQGGGAPRPAPTGAPGGRVGGARGVSGKITKISGGTVTVEARSFGAPPTADQPIPAAPVGTTTLRTVSTTSATTYTRTVKASKSALVVGKCVTALGTADTTGALTATSISVRPAENGACTVAFGRAGSAAGAPAGAAAIAPGA